jgi:hypothetical protein
LLGQHCTRGDERNGNDGEKRFMVHEGLTIKRCWPRESLLEPRGVAPALPGVLSPKNTLRSLLKKTARSWKNREGSGQGYLDCIKVTLSKNPSYVISGLLGDMMK